MGDISKLTSVAPVRSRLHSTGLLSMDLCLGGGVTPGSCIEVVGEPTAGKTCVALLLSADSRVLYVDLDRSLSYPSIQQYTPGSIDDLHMAVIPPDFTEQDSGSILQHASDISARYLILDSTGSCYPSSVDTLHRLFRKQRSRDLSLIITSQVRTSFSVFGHRHVSSWRGAPPADIAMRLSRRGTSVLASVIRNRFYPHGQFQFMIGQKGVDRGESIARVAYRIGMIHNEGSVILYGKRNLGRGFSEAGRAILADAALHEVIRTTAQDRFIRGR